jgi:Fe-S cluster assembly protein SufD
MEMQTLIDGAIQFRAKNENEPEWIYELRNLGWNSYLNSPTPDRVHHLWRYSDPGQFMIAQPEKVAGAMNRRPEIFNAKELQPESGMDAYAANNSNMKSIFQTSADFKESGAVFEEYHKAISSHPDLVKAHIGKLISAEFGKFESLNLAFWNNGIFVYVPDNTIIEKPIYLYRHPTGSMTFTRLLVILGKNAEATIIDDYKCPCNKEATLLNSAVEIYAGDSSRVRYVNMQRLQIDNRAYITQRTQLGNNAESYTLFASMGSGVSKINAGTVLNGRGASSNMFGIAFGDGKQKFDHHTTHHHKASDSYSNIDFKVVLKDKAYSAYTGLIKIEKEAVNCEAYQENRNLLLNKGPKAETIPELEILTDQVRCTHGATVGPIDPEMIFYLTSRGIDYNQAVRVIVSGFVEPTLGKMPQNLGDTIRDIVYAKLEDK